MKKSVIVILAISLVITAAAIYYKFGPQRVVSNHSPVSMVSEQVTVSSSEPLNVSIISANSNSVSVEPSSSTSNGLITLRLNPSFSRQLPSAEAAKKAMEMNKELTMAQQRGQ